MHRLSGIFAKCSKESNSNLRFKFPSSSRMTNCILDLGPKFFLSRDIFRSNSSFLSILFANLTINKWEFLPNNSSRNGERIKSKTAKEASDACLCNSVHQITFSIINLTRGSILEETNSSQLHSLIKPTSLNYTQ